MPFIAIAVDHLSTALGTINDDHLRVALTIAKIIAHIFGVPYFEDGTL